MNPEITIPRREKLAELLTDGDHVIIFANPSRNLEKFSQDNNFLYFTGLNHPELIYLAWKFSDRFHDMLFIERCDPERVVWEGAKLEAAEATEISGIKRVKYLDEFYGTLSAMTPMIKRIYANLGYAPLNKPMTLPMFMLEPIRQRFPQIQINQLNELITPLRKIKDGWEIQQLQKAIDITGKGLQDVMESATANMMEYELEATLFYRMQRSGVKNWGFAPIVASGINAATLHYEQNNCRVETGDLILMDVGASYNNYSADVTRCFPAGPTFSERQKQVYSAVLEVQKRVIELIKPGVALSTLNISARDWLAEQMVSLGLITDTKDVALYYMHSVSHFLGMDTHDLGGREAVLEPGNVITVEPGIYIPEEKLGVRIEDDVLVTEEGHSVLSQKIPKEINEIEEIRKAAFKNEP